MISLFVDASRSLLLWVPGPGIPRTLSTATYATTPTIKRSKGSGQLGYLSNHQSNLIFEFERIFMVRVVNKILFMRGHFKCKVALKYSIGIIS